MSFARRAVPVFALALCGAFLGGCQLERLFPHKVATGAARLSFRNTAILVALVSEDARCGFLSPAVQESAVVVGEIGSAGELVHRVEGCALDLGALKVIRTDCSGHTTSVGGRVVVSAERRVRGVLTGNPESPVIPEGPDAVTMHFRAEPSDYMVRISNHMSQLTQRSGAFSFTTYPHLAVSKSSGLCAVATPNLTITNLVYEGAVLLVDSGEGSPFEVEVPTSSLTAQLGKYGQQENHLEGSITVWDSKQSVPDLEDAFGNLDPGYDSEEFAAAYACTEDLAVPVRYECASLGPALAQGAAQLGISTFGNLVKLADERCFSQPHVLEDVAVTGDVGHAGGSARYAVTACAIDLPERTAIAQDCLGKVTYAEGRVVVSGAKVLRGIRTGDPLEPIVPVSWEPALITLSASLQGFAITDEANMQRLWLREGKLSGTSRPRTARDSSLGVCSLPTPVAAFEDVAFEGAVGDLLVSGNTLTLRLADSRLTAQNGKAGERENYLAGTLTLDGETYAIPTSGEPLLDPSYSPSTFYASYSCTPQLEIPASDADCSVTRMLGENAARLLVLSAGTVAEMINADDACGFETTSVLLSPTSVVGAAGELGSMSWDVSDCELSGSAIRAYSTDCMGTKTWVRGGVVVDATRTVRGEREKQYLVIDSVIPRSRDAVTISLPRVELHDFVAYEVAAADEEPAGKLTLHSGTLAAVVSPRLGERESKPGIFDVASPAADIGALSLPGAEATLESAGKTFKLSLSDVQISARNGVFQGYGNTIAGSLRVNGELVEFGPIDLNPDYTQAAFDAGYACTEDLLAVIPADEG
jgi:hypothetical protein